MEEVEHGINTYRSAPAKYLCRSEDQCLIVKSFMSTTSIESLPLPRLSIDPRQFLTLAPMGPEAPDWMMVTQISYPDHAVENSYSASVLGR